ncbi:MAG: hypothetical protein Q7S48_00135 [bacterium]|nr:hypothetical protein [bacterium]
MKNKKDEFKSELLAMKEAVEKALELLAQGSIDEAKVVVARGLSAVPLGSLVVVPQENGRATEPTKVPEGSRVIEGVFDGQHMMGGDGKQYMVPPNYASKSKLVEGDILKLAITADGAFIYKQIGPTERKRVTCTIIQSEQGLFEATDRVHRWRLLTAAVTYFKGNVGDEAVILIPSDAPSKWAALENIIAK